MKDERKQMPSFTIHRPICFKIHSSCFPLDLHQASRITRLSICALLGCFLSCGVQGPPQPPRVQRPETITDLMAAQKGRTLQLAFTLPLRARDGERLTKPLEIEIFRAVSKPGTVPPNSFTGIAPWLTLSPADLARYNEGGKVVYPARISDVDFARSRGETITLGVAGLTFGFRRRILESEISKPVHLVLLEVSAPVENLQVKSAEKALELSWSPPTFSLTGQPLPFLSGYRVYWSLTGKPATYQVRGESTAPTFSDSKFLFGQTRFYKVRAIFRQSGQEAESDDSAVVEITPRDTFPPAAPTRVSGLWSSDAVQLVWTANTESDLAGYNVYRRDKVSEWQRINPQLLLTPAFEDKSAVEGQQYSYRVTAVDNSHNESAPSSVAAIEAL